MFALMCGMPMDSGFGDYSEPDYLGENTYVRDDSGYAVTFDSIDDAIKVRDILNEKSEQALYARHTPEAFDGIFPYECKIIELPDGMKPYQEENIQHMEKFFFDKAQEEMDRFV